MTDQLLIVGVGGSTRRGSSTTNAIEVVLKAAERLGAHTRLFDGDSINLPAYDPNREERTPGATELVEFMYRADGLVIGSPGYHGSVSGLVKNALDYAEDLRLRTPPYLDGKPVGCIATAYGWQAAVGTLATLRQIVHALRGWPTPLGVAINMSLPDGTYTNQKVSDALSTVGEQLVDFTLMKRGAFSNVS